MVFLLVWYRQPYLIYTTDPHTRLTLSTIYCELLWCLLMWEKKKGEINEWTSIIKEHTCDSSACTAPNAELTQLLRPLVVFPPSFSRDDTYVVCRRCLSSVAGQLLCASEYVDNHNCKNNVKTMWIQWTCLVATLCSILSYYKTFLLFPNDYI